MYYDHDQIFCLYFPLIKLQYMLYKNPGNLPQIELESMMIYNKESTKCH